MQEQKKLQPRISSDAFFWTGLFASPVLSCLIFSFGAGVFDHAAGPFLGIFLVLVTLGGAFYCGFKLGWRCSRNTAVKVLLSLLFTLGFLVLDFAVFFIGCCAAISLYP